MTSLDPSHIPNPFAKSKHTQWGAATHEVDVDIKQPSHRRRSSASISAPTSPQRHHFKLPVPDLRFEQSYLLSIKPFIKDVEPETDEELVETYTEETEREKTSKALAKDAGVIQSGRHGLPVQLDWIGIVWVTVRDQMISPMIQGAVFGTLSIFVLPYVRSRLFCSRTPPKPKQAVPPATPEEIPLWRNWVNSIFGAIQTNVTLRG